VAQQLYNVPVARQRNPFPLVENNNSWAPVDNKWSEGKFTQPYYQPTYISQPGVPIFYQPNSPFPIQPLTAPFPQKPVTAPTQQPDVQQTYRQPMQLEDDTSDGLSDGNDVTYCPSNGEMRIYDSLLELSGAIDMVAENMKTYSYPSQDDINIMLDQDTYSAGGLQRKISYSENLVQGVLKQISQMMKSLPPLEEKIAPAQEACYLAKLYGVAHDDTKERDKARKIDKIVKRKEDQRKLAAKRERERKRYQRERKMVFKPQFFDMGKYDGINNH